MYRLLVAIFREVDALAERLGLGELSPDTTTEDWIGCALYCELHNNCPKTAETSAIRVS
jgi:hypothetical protein